MDDWDTCCPVCVTPFSEQDKRFRPCVCTFRMCVWCWHTIVTMATSDYMEAVCPGCRTPYDVPAIQKLQSAQPPTKAKATRKAAPARAHLADVVLNDKRVVAIRNIPAALLDVAPSDAAGAVDESAAGAAPAGNSRQQSEAHLFALGQHFLFGQYGRIVGAVVIYSGLGPNRMPTYSAAIRYASSDDAARCVRFAHNSLLLGHTLSCKLVPTRYCSQFLLKSMCTKRMCVELHHEHSDKTLHVKPPPALFSVLGAAEGQHQPQSQNDNASDTTAAPEDSLGRDTRRAAEQWANDVASKCVEDIQRQLAHSDIANASLLMSSDTDVHLTPLSKMAGQQSVASFDMSTPLGSSSLLGDAAWSQPAGSGKDSSAASHHDVHLRARMATETRQWLQSSDSKSELPQCNPMLAAVLRNLPPHVPAVAASLALAHPTVLKSRSA